jgi:hypothetical protein
MNNNSVVEAMTNAIDAQTLILLRPGAAKHGQGGSPVAQLLVAVAPLPEALFVEASGCSARGAVANFSF